jgi:hypothetical protein
VGGRRPPNAGPSQGYTEGIIGDDSHFKARNIPDNGLKGGAIMQKPTGDSLRNAVKWISNERQDRPETSLHKLIDEASTKFNLNPMESNSLERMLKEGKDQ